MMGYHGSPSFRPESVVVEPGHKVAQFGLQGLREVLVGRPDRHLYLAGFFSKKNVYIIGGAG